MWKDTRLHMPITAIDALSPPQAGAQPPSSGCQAGIPLMQLAVPGIE